MTKEEAVARIKDHIEIHKYHEQDAVKILEALDMAIKALEEPEPCEDAVSREAVHNMLENIPIGLNEKWFNWLQKACLRLAELPSVHSEQRWIPVSESERLPKNREWVLGIFQEGDTGWINPIPFICDYVGKKTPITTQDNWLLKMVDEPHPYYKMLHCIAWMPLPESYKAESEEV